MNDLSLAAIGKRILWLLASMLVLLLLTFVVGRVLPGDPVTVLVGELADQAAYEAMRQRLGLDLPLYQQFAIYLGDLARGDLGRALLTGNAVSSDIATAFPATVELAVLAILISTLIGVPLGLFAGLMRDTVVDHFARVVSLFGHSIPIFWFGIVALIIFYANLRWVGGPGRVDIYYEGIIEPRTGMMLIDSLLSGDMDVFRNALSHIILPACILAYASMAYITRMTRSFTLEQIGQDYVIAGRAKGLRPAALVVKHLLPNIAVQLITVLAVAFGNMLEGAVVLELVFSWPGLGQYMTNALMMSDMNAVLGCTVVIGLSFMLLNFFADIAYLVIDPRTRESVA